MHENLFEAIVMNSTILNLLHRLNQISHDVDLANTVQQRFFGSCSEILLVLSVIAGGSIVVGQENDLNTVNSLLYQKTSVLSAGSVRRKTQPTDSWSSNVLYSAFRKDLTKKNQLQSSTRWLRPRVIRQYFYSETVCFDSWEKKQNCFIHKLFKMYNECKTI